MPNSVDEECTGKLNIWYRDHFYLAPIAPLIKFLNVEVPMLTIKVLGPGCDNCKKVEQVTSQAVTNMGMQADVIKVTDYNEIMQYNLLSTPGLVINENVVCAGRIPSQAEVTSWLADAAMESA